MPSPSEQVDLFRIIDANANRAAEGLRVVEDYVRFGLDDSILARRCKEIRHRLSDALSTIAFSQRAAARDSLRDVGSDITTESEYKRASSEQVAQANLKRIQQAVRSLEEYTKIVAPEAALTIERLRYECYTLEKAMQATAKGIERLQHAKLYVLVDGATSADDFQSRVHWLIDAGVPMLQLRDKRLDDRTLLARARALRQMTRDTATLFIMNDRPDLAALARADGVHVGQDELLVKDVRQIVGVDMLVGVSTHSIQQARQAVLDGANYVGVGPMFPSETKRFDQFPGLDLIAKVSELSLPTFAIGGINGGNVTQVIQAGCKRVALSNAVWAADDPGQAAKGLLTLLS